MPDDEQAAKQSIQPDDDGFFTEDTDPNLQSIMPDDERQNNNVDIVELTDGVPDDQVPDAEDVENSGLGFDPT